MPSSHSLSSDLDSLKKRKREKHDQASISKPKRPRAQTKPIRVNGTQNDVPRDLQTETESQSLAISPSKPKRARQQKQKQGGVLERTHAVPWKVSEPMGGRMADVDPIFTPDERYVNLIFEK